MEGVAADANELRVEPSGGSGPCTADLTPTTHELALPGSVTGRPTTLTLTYPERAATSTLTLE
ncbi:hypothetical protein [Paeniglutamicibacter sp.]|uniref:hypothetical protein n=1 Tax=Paeniglutamicibacter sp. TaxID=1934391 RepID=UPI003988F48C